MSAKLTADSVYNEMLLSFRDADFRVAAYKAMVTGKEIGRAIVTAARSAAGAVSARNATVSAFIERQEAAGLHRREEYARDSDLVVRDATGSIGFSRRFDALFPLGSDSRKEVEAAIEADITNRAALLIKSGEAAAAIDAAIRKACFEFEPRGCSVFIGYPCFELPPLAIELRPELGSEYPAVLRAMRKRDGDGRPCLIVQRVSGAETLETIRWVFEQGHAGIATMAEIEKAAFKP